MDIKDIEGRIKSMNASVKKGRLEEAFERLDEVAALVRASWDMRERIRRAHENYRLMSDFALTGGKDDSRAARYEELSNEAMALGDAMLREAKSAETPTLYYSTLRFERTRPGDSIKSLADQYVASVESGAEAVTLESLEGRLFNRIWTTHPLSDADAEALTQYVAAGDSPMPDHARRLMLSALMLGGAEWADDKKMSMLLKTYEQNSVNPMGIEALTAAVLMSIANGHVATDMAAWADNDDTHRRRKDLEMVVKQVISAYDTERIRRKMTDEVIPELMKLKPEIDRRISELTRDAEGMPLDLSSIEENPEWDDMMSKSGLADKLREMNDLQMEGADVMMSTFASLKSFPFFNDPSNWFLPFHAGHSVARKAGDKAVDKLSKLVESMPMLCDSDKYSLLLLTGHMGGTGFTNMMSGLEEQADALNDEVRSELDAASKERVSVARRYVQNVYRFFKLFRRKGEFRDPFVKTATPLDSAGIRNLFAGGGELARMMAEFLFKRGHYAESLPLLQEVASGDIPTAELYQKIGYAMQRTGNNDGALEMYQNSDLLRGDSKWTLKRIAALLRAKGRSREAAEYLRRAYELDNDSVELTMSLAGALLESGKPKEALNLYYKADYLKPSEKTTRLIAWCLLLSGDYERCREAYDNLGRLPGGYTASDLMNLGHLDMIFGRYQEAAEHYASAIADYDFDIERFEEELAQDRKVLERKGIDPLTIDIIADRSRQMASGAGSRI